MSRIAITAPVLLTASLLSAQTTYDYTIPTEYNSVNSYVYFAFPSTPATMGEGTLSLQWAACYTAGFSPSSITVQVSTSNGWQTVLDEADNTSSCVFVNESVVIEASVFADAIAIGSGSLQCRMTADDGCQPGVGCSFLNDPVVRNLRLVYTVRSAAFNVSSSTTCPGGILNFTNESLNAPSAFQWTFQGGVPATSTAADPVVQFNTPGSYAVTLIVQTNEGPDTLVVPGAVTVYDPPPANAGPDQDICIGDGAQLEASGGVEYEWVPTTWLDFPNYVAPYSVPLDDITYNVLVTDANGCQATDAVTVYVHEPPVITVGTGGNVHCIGDTIDMVAQGAFLYTWSPAFYLSSTSGAAIQAWPDMDYGWTVTGVDIYGCTGTADVYIDMMPAAVAPVVTEQAGVLVSTTATSYQWYLEGVLIPGATSNPYAPLANGNYTVVITDGNGCQATSEAVYYGSTGLSTVAKPAFRVYPQPANDVVMVEGLIAGAQLVLLDATGRTVRIVRSSADTIAHLDLRDVSAGTLVLEMRVAGRVERAVIVH